METGTEPRRAWRFSRGERWWLGISLFALLAFGANVEQRTALRHTPMTDLGVFACAAGAVCSGENLYTITDWHGWHYHYPPVLAIAFVPLAETVPVAPATLPKGVARTDANTPWGYEIASHARFFGLHAANLRFFFIVAIWYGASVALIILSVHALACTLERGKLSGPPPTEPRARRRWWWLRVLPILVCAGSLGTELSRGQVDVVMLAAMALGLYFAAAGKDVKAGLWLSLPATIKLFPILLVTYPVWRLRWRMIAGLAAGAVLTLAVLPAVTMGPQRTISLYETWLDVLAKPALGQGGDTSRTRELTGLAGTDNQSILAFIHNWRYHSIPRDDRPQQAAPTERYAAYAAGAFLLAGVVFVLGGHRPDSPRDLLIVAGILMAVGLLTNPVSHNYYFLLLLPLVAGLLDWGLAGPLGQTSNLKVLWVVAAFMLTDVVTRLPGIGHWARDVGLPLLSVVGLIAAGAVALRQGASRPFPALDFAAGSVKSGPRFERSQNEIQSHPSRAD